MSFVEHFDSGALPSGWGAYATGNASHSYSDSKVTSTWTTGATGSSALYYATAIDKTKRQRWAMCKRAGQNAPNAFLRVISNTGAPSSDTRANIDAKTLLRITDFTSGTRKGQLSYRDTTPAFVHWDDTSKTWGTTSNPSIPTKTNDDYDIVGFEFDPNGGTERWRLFWIHVATGTTFPTEGSGPKLFALTDWVNASSMEDGAGTELYVCLGVGENDFELSGHYDIEWVAMDDGTYMEGVTNQRNYTGADYDLKAWSKLGVDGSIVLPHTRTGAVVTISGQAWHNTRTQFKSLIRGSNGTLYLAYNGNNGSGGNEVGIASGSSLTAGLTDYASNPIIPAAGSGDFNALNQVALVEDFTDPDTNRRWKMFVSSVGADSKVRVYLLTATSAAGPVTTSWSNEGIFLDADGEDADGGLLHLRPVYSRGEWTILYNGGLGSSTQVKWGTCRTLEVGQLVKRGVLFDGLSGDEMTPTSWTSSSRTVTGTVPASFTKDMLVLYDADATAENWGLSRIRKVNAGDIELYHYIPGGTTSGRLRGFDAGAITVHDIREFKGEWWLDVTFYFIFDTHATFDAFCEVCGIMRGPTVTGPFTIDWFRTPQARWGRDNNNHSSENIAWEGSPTYPQTHSNRMRQRRLGTLLRR